MPSVIEHLYYGNIDPNSGRYPQDSPFVQAAYRKMKLLEQMKESFTPSQQEWFDKFCDAQCEQEEILRHDAFAYALKFGVRLMAEIFLDGEEADRRGPFAGL